MTEDTRSIITIIPGGDMLFSDMCVQYQNTLSLIARQLFKHDDKYIPQLDDIMVEIAVSSRKHPSWCRQCMPDNILKVLNNRITYPQFVHYLPLRSLTLGPETIDVQLSNRHHCILRKYNRFDEKLTSIIEQF